MREEYGPAVESLCYLYWKIIGKYNVAVPRNILNLSAIFEIFEMSINEVEKCSTKMNNVFVAAPSGDENNEKLTVLQLTLHLVHFFMQGANGRSE